MPRSLVLSNSHTMVCLDQFASLRDLYYPYVGQENHTMGKFHRIGVWVNGAFSWLDDGSWNITMSYKSQTMIGLYVCKNARLGVSLVIENAVYNEANVFLRKIDVYNLTETPAEIRLFFGAEFVISESKKRNTAFYDPTHNVITHYKGRRVFIINGMNDHGEGFDQYTVGAFQFEGKEGSFRDAEDGELSRNAVEHGSVDSVVRFCTSCTDGKKQTLYFWICVGKSLDEAYALNAIVQEKTPAAMFHSTEEYWRAWLQKKDFGTEVLPPEQKKLFENSLFVLRAHTDAHGSIIASADSEMIVYGKDDYAYMWPRDAAFIVSVLDKAGYTEVTPQFFRFCKDVLHPDGYLHHRFRPDQSLGSTWHSSIKQQEWLKDAILQLPIQEDESAAVLYALWNHYEHTKNIEFIEEMFKPFIEKIANFLVKFRHEPTGLPLHSYDLWEEKIGVSTYTCAAVYGGLTAAARFCELLGKRNHMREYAQAAKDLKHATQMYLFSPQRNAFIRMAYVRENGVEREEIVDASSLFGLWYFGMLDEHDEQFRATEKTVQHVLKNTGPVGGYIRYEHDEYFRSTDHSNPWFIITLWEAQRVLHREVLSAQDLEFVHQTLQWAVQYMTASGVLAEQLNPYTGESLSATPLVWSHAVYIETVLTFLEKLKTIGVA